MNKLFAKTIRIGKHTISQVSPTFIIAEIGSNHDQSVAQAKKLVDAAIASGADAVKFQSLNFSEQYLESKTSFKTKSLHAEVDFSDDKMREVALYAQKKGTIFLSAPTYLNAVDFLEELKVPVYKIASPVTVGFSALIKKAAKTMKPIIVSTGYCSQQDVTRAVKAVESTSNDKMIILYCTSQYPTEASDINFGYMLSLQSRYKCLIGFSDHTMSTTIPAIAVACGARVIEKHLTLSRKLKGPDHPFAIEPNEFKQMVRNIRDTEKVASKPKSSWRPMLTTEIALKQMMMTKLVTAADLPAGTKLTQAHILFRRAPKGAGIPEYEVSKVLGKILLRPLKRMSLIKSDDLKK